MLDGVLPPFVDPTGPRYSDAKVLADFVHGYCPGFSEHFHAEGPALMVDRSDAAALRIGPTTVLVRLDPPDDVLDARPLVEEALTGAGLSLIDHNTLLAAPVAIHLLALRLSEWDLWGADLDESFACLRLAAVGDVDDSPLAAAGSE